MVSTMLHPWRWQMWGLLIQPLILLKKQRMLSFWIRTWWSLRLAEGTKVYAIMTKHIRDDRFFQLWGIFSLLLFASIFLLLPMVLSISSFLNLVCRPSPKMPCLRPGWIRTFEEQNLGEVKSITRFKGLVRSYFPSLDILDLYHSHFSLSYQWLQDMAMSMVDSAGTLHYALQIGWFIESMWSQTMAVYMLCSSKIALCSKSISFLLSWQRPYCRPLVTFLSYHMGPLASLLK